MSDDKLFVTDDLLPIPFEDIRILSEAMFNGGDGRVEEVEPALGRVAQWLDAWEIAEKEGCHPAIMLPPRVRETFSIDYEDEL